jgi:hypothetical protein
MEYKKFEILRYMETQTDLKTRIFSLLDDIVEINEEIILHNDKGLSHQTLQGLQQYKNGLIYFLDKVKMINNKN